VWLAESPYALLTYLSPTIIRCRGTLRTVRTAALRGVDPSFLPRLHSDLYTSWSHSASTACPSGGDIVCGLHSLTAACPSGGSFRLPRSLFISSPTRFPPFSLAARSSFLSFPFPNPYALLFARVPTLADFRSGRSALRSTGVVSVTLCSHTLASRCLLTLALSGPVVAFRARVYCPLDCPACSRSHSFIR